MQLSICICTIPGRESSLAQLNLKISNQISNGYKDVCELLYLGDNRSMTLGTKRNRLKQIARGKYIIYVDDDDDVSDDYVQKLVEATYTDVDVITIESKVTGVYDNVSYNCKFDLEILYNFDDHCNKTYWRIPNHICAIKADVYKSIPHPDITWGEDEAIKWLVKANCKTQYHIDSQLYHYKFDPINTSCPMPK